MSCETILSKLPLFAGGDLDLRAAATVEGHLQRCLSCFREYQRQVELLERVRRAAEESVQQLPALGDTFAASVMGQIDGPPPLPRLVPRLILASGWAAALLLGAFLAWTQGPLGDGGSPLEPDASSTLFQGAAPVTAIDLPEDFLRVPNEGRPLRLVPDEELSLEELPFDEVERLLFGRRFQSTPVSYPIPMLKDY